MSNRLATLDAGVAHDVMKRAAERHFAHEKDLAFDASERAATHRFGVHLERELLRLDAATLGMPPSDLSVDCEYNRDGDHTKKLVGLEDEVRSTAPAQVVRDLDEAGSPVYPDIIVHRRGRPGPNLIVIEAKRDDANARDIEFDRKKLRLFVGQLKYQHAFLVLFHPDRAPTLEVVAEDVRSPG